MLTHGVDHYQPESCFGCRIKTISFAPSIFATTPGGAKAASKKGQEKKLVRDLDAFKRMRLSGLEPRATRGAAKVESECESPYEVATGRPAHTQAKGPDAGKSITRRGKEFRRRANEAHEAIRRGEVVTG